MFKVTSFNANGLRAAARKGFFDWFAGQNIDVLCVQELKAHEEQLDTEVFNPKGYVRYCQCAEKKGYSGVAIYAKQEPLRVETSFGWQPADNEGRYIFAEFEHINVASVYLPSGTSGDERQQYKYAFMEEFTPHLDSLQTLAKPTIICGDWNIVHKEIDIKNWRANQKNSGCLPEERAWLDQVFGSMQWVDAFRVINQQPHQYTWWSQRGQARANNVGWRIDYQVVSSELRDNIIDTSIYTTENFSDHAPLTLTYKR